MIKPKAVTPVPQPHPEGEIVNQLRWPHYPKHQMKKGLLHDYMAKSLVIKLGGNTTKLGILRIAQFLGKVVLCFFSKSWMVNQGRGIWGMQVL